MKPRITMYRRRNGTVIWVCSGGSRYTGQGTTPAEAYESWYSDMIPF